MASAHCLLLRRDLGTPLPAASWPATLRLSPYQAHLAAKVYQLMQQGYANGGDLPEFDTWRRHFETDAEYDPALCFIAHDAEGLVGVAQCWTSAYIKDLVVHPRARGQGIGRALLLHAFEVFRQRREGFVDLKVREDNLPARELYASVGMTLVRREPLPTALPALQP